MTPLGAFGARWLLGLIPLTTNCRPEAPRGGGGGSWRPRTRGVAPPPPRVVTVQGCGDMEHNIGPTERLCL